MARMVHRAMMALRLEALEARTLLSVDAASVNAPWATPVTPVAATTLLVRFKSGTTPAQTEAALAAVGGRVSETFPDGPEVIALAPWDNTSSALRGLQADTIVAYADPDSQVHAAGAVIPNDPLYSQEWGMAAIDAPYAWGLTTGTPATIIAVLDTGIDLNTPDLDTKLWTNPNPYGDPGYPGDLHGWNFVSNSSDLQDNNGHGTHVTGILAALGNDGQGIAGVDWNATIMPLKILDSQGNGSTDAAVSAIYFAVQHGARVINASWGGDNFSQAMLDALNYANANNVVFVTASGNESSNNDAVTSYPASYRTPNELVVAAVDQNGQLASFSNVGPTTVDLAAPGVGIVSTVPGGYASYDGTSMATPFVAGTVALLEGAYPGMTASQLVNQVRATVKPDSALNGLMISPGIVDPFFALLDHVALSGVAASTAPVLVPGATSYQNVENVMLSDNTVYDEFGGTPQSYVTGLYESLLDRAPSASEVNLFAAPLQAGTTSRSAIVGMIQNSPEANLARVAGWYRDVLGSTESVAALKANPGVAFWAGQLAGGQPVANVLSAMLASAPYVETVGGTNTAWLSALYNDVLGRGIDPAGFGYFMSELNGGMSRVTVAQQLLASPEAHRVAIARLYRDELHVPGAVSSLEYDPGVDFWAGFLGTD